MVGLSYKGSPMEAAHAQGLHLIYPESDGKPMAENTTQFEWIVLIKLGLEACFEQRDDIFIAGDLLWYPVEHHPEISMAPDVLVAPGRPKGHRGSYMQWVEGGIPPRVVFEILSPGNRKKDLDKKFAFYQQYGVEEYYTYNAHRNKFSAWMREEYLLKEVPQSELRDWVSPLLGIRLEWTSKTLHLYSPDGKRFLSYLELIQEGRTSEQRMRDMEQLAKAEQKRAAEAMQIAREEWLRAQEEQQRAEQLKQLAESEKRRAESEMQRAEKETQRVEQEKQRAEQEKQRADRLAEQLRRLGIDPDAGE